MFISHNFVNGSTYFCCYISNCPLLIFNFFFGLNDLILFESSLQFSDLSSLSLITVD